jgi:hypothetical protein
LDDYDNENLDKTSCVLWMFKGYNFLLWVLWSLSSPKDVSKGAPIGIPNFPLTA